MQNISKLPRLTVFSLAGHLKPGRGSLVGQHTTLECCEHNFFAIAFDINCTRPTLRSTDRLGLFVSRTGIILAQRGPFSVTRPIAWSFPSTAAKAHGWNLSFLHYACIHQAH